MYEKFSQRFQNLTTVFRAYIFSTSKVVDQVLFMTETIYMRDWDMQGKESFLRNNWYFHNS